MEPDSYTPDHQASFERYRELKEKLNKEMEKWTVLSQELEDFLQKNEQ